MKVDNLIRIIGGEFFVGVPDSQLKELCNYLMVNKTLGENHIIAANEGNCVGIAAGHYMATSDIPVVYMQNSGLGNIVNPVTSLLDAKVYGIPCIFIIGWRGEPGVKDEPQHIFQGEITQQLLNDLNIDFFVITKQTSEKELEEAKNQLDTKLGEGKSIAFLVKKDALELEESINYSNSNVLVREEVIKNIVQVAEDDIIISTTGKASRELFEIREERGEGHEKDFLTVGSMGHSSSIALGIALEKKEKKIWCIDGDGAMLMHMGSLAVIGNIQPSNLIHVVINNEAHETVGGMPTAVGQTDILKVALGCGYNKVMQVNEYNDLLPALQRAKENNELTLVEVKCKISSRKDLGRPTTSARDNKEKFMKYLSDCR